MERKVVSNRILNRQFEGALDKEQLRWPTEFGGFGLCRYLTQLRKERPDIKKGSEADKIMFQVIQSCYKYEHAGVCPVLSEPVAWFLEAEYLRGQEPKFPEGMDTSLPDMDLEEREEMKPDAETQEKLAPPALEMRMT